MVRFFRLANVLRYVTDKAYLKYPLFQLWNRDHVGEEVGLQRAAGWASDGVLDAKAGDKVQLKVRRPASAFAPEREQEVAVTLK